MEIQPTLNGYELGRRLGYQGPRRGLCHSTPCDKSARMTKKDNKTEHLVSTGSSQDRLKKVGHDRPKDESELERCEVCLKYFKRGRGLKIHQTKMGCKKKLEETGLHRTSGKSEVGSIQEQNHSVAASRVDQNNFEQPQLHAGEEDSQKDIERKQTKQTQITSWLKSIRGKENLGKSTQKCPNKRPTGEHDRSNKEEATMVSENRKLAPSSNSGEQKNSLMSWLETYGKREYKRKQMEEVKGNIGPEDISVEDLKSRQQNITIGPPDEVLVKHHLNMTRSDFRSLASNNYVNDKIIDQYLRLIKERNDKDQELPSVATQTVFFFKKLDRLGLEEGSKQTENWIKENLLEKDLFLIPIHKKDHWSLIGVDMNKLTVEYFDSIKGSRNTSNAPKVIKKYMENYCKERGKDVEFRIRIRQDVPLQTNGVDCGVFTCVYAEKLAKKSSMNFNQRDMTATRMKMTHEIFLGTILNECPGQIHALLLEGGEKKETTKAQKKTGKKKLNEEPKAGDRSRKDRINWPKANSKEWKELDTDITSLLKTMYSTSERKAESHPKIIYAMCKERFGTKEIHKKQVKCTKGPSRRQRKCKALREEIKKLQYVAQQAPEEEKPAIYQLHKAKLKSLRLAKRAESIRKGRKEYSKNCSEFRSQPFEFSRKIISPKPSGNLQSTKQEVEEHIKKAHDDPLREEERKVQEDLWEYEKPEGDFNNKPPTWAEFRKHLWKTRSKSAPGPNGVPYIIYKRCPGVARQLWLYLKTMWEENAISDSWRKAEGIFIPKIDGATSIDKFRTISLLNVEGKIYFALRADRLLKFVQENGYIDPSIQKGGLPSISGCLEHTAVLSQLIREAKLEKKNLVITWLDIANAYGSIPHNIILTALRRAHVPEEIVDLVERYYVDVKIRFTTQQFTTEWQRVEKGIITGCTLSVILFALTMTMLVMSVKDETKGPKTSSGQQQVSCRLFMDDIATTTETTVQTKHLLNRLTEKLNWAGLKVKPEKCRSMVIERGKISTRTVNIEGKPITSITEKPVKYLGKTYNMSLDEKQQIGEITKQAKADLRKIDRCRLPGRFKPWIVQHMLLPRLMWPLSIYNVPESKVESIQRLITASLKKWLGLPKSLSVDCLYSKSSKLQLPFTALTEEVKVAKVRNLVTLNNSVDPCISNANISVDGGKKSNTPAEVKDATYRLKIRDLVGTTNTGREGLGANQRLNLSSCTKKEERDLICAVIREAEEEQRRIKMVQLGKQGNSVRWEVPEKKLSHSDILNTSAAALKFRIKAVHDLLPTPANKNKWYGSNNECTLCGKPGTLNHILSGCRVALSQGRYKWRHDQVLEEVAKSVEEQRKVSLTKPPCQEKIEFVKEGEQKAVDRNSQPGSYFDNAKDWKIQVDLKTQVKIPTEIMQTDLRPDIVMSSAETKRLGIIELTVPSEERIEVSGELKRSKYQEIVEEAKSKGWKVRIWCVEVGCKGFPAASMANLLKDLGLSGTKRNNCLRRIGNAAELASNTLWKRSFYKDWGGRSV